jgi:ribosome-binding protein aMBF1 (putative translation factor)
MNATEPAVQIDQIEAMERDLVTARRAVARTLRFKRETVGLSLRDVAPKLRLSAAALSNIERGKSWRTRTIRRLAKFYDAA